MVFSAFYSDGRALIDEASRLSTMTLEALNDATVTIAARSFLWMQPAALHFPEQQGEAQLMVVEKVEAVIAGAGAALSASLSVGLEAMSGRLNPFDSPARSLAILNASFAPAHERVGANARRLTAQGLAPCPTF